MPYAQWQEDGLGGQDALGPGLPGDSTASAADAGGFDAAQDAKAADVAADSVDVKGDAAIADADAKTDAGDAKTDAGDAQGDSGADGAADADAGQADAQADSGVDAKVDGAADSGADAADAAVNCPGKGPVPETCNNKDDDCDGETDEGETLCDDQQACSIDTCAAGKCIHMQSTDGTCEDGNECTTDDQCIGALCLPGQPVACGDGNPCTTNGCDPKKGCVFEAAPGPCDDDNPCTTGEACSGGECKGGAISACDDKNPCTDDSCVAPLGCKYTPNSAVCSDGSDCTVGDLCSGGACKPGKGQVCNDANACTTDNCTPGVGCTFTNHSLTCDDSNACTTGDACVAGSCKAGVAKTCTDSNPCTADSCDPLKGCVFSSVADGTACAGGICSAGVCAAGAVCGNGKLEVGEKCDDGNLLPCDTCNATCSGAGSGVTLGGSYTIAAVGGNFASFAAALKALGQCGVKAPTTFSVAAGSYTEAGFLFAPIPGASAVNMVTFQAVTPGAVKLVGVTGASSYSGVIKVDSNAKFITLDGFDIDGSLAANKVPSSYSGPVVFGSGGGQQGITLKRLRIHDFGPAAWATTSYTGGIYIQQQGTITDLTIEGCTFDNLAPPAAFHTQGAISTRFGNYSNLRIVGNRFSGLKFMDALNLRAGTGWKDLWIANNFFAIAEVGAIEFYGGATLLSAARIQGNTFLFSGTGKYAVSGAVAGASIDFRGNIVASLVAGAVGVSASTFAPAGGNCLNSKVTAGYVATVPDVVGEPLFVSAAAPWDLHLKAGSPCLNKGLPLPGLTTDIDGQVRGLVPDLGADELP